MKKGNLSANSVQLGLTLNISIQETFWNVKVEATFEQKKPEFYLQLWNLNGK